MTNSGGTCELCHRLKEKCITKPGDAACHRCTVGGKPCQRRKKKRLGRRPGTNTFPRGSCFIVELGDGDEAQREHSQGRELAIRSSPISTSNSMRSSSIKGAQLFLNLSPMITNMYGWPTMEDHAWITHVLQNKEAFFATHRNFILGSGFCDVMQGAAQRTFTRAPQAMALAYTALFRLQTYRMHQPSGAEGLDATLGSRCFQWFLHESSCVSTPEDAAVVLYMGQVLMIYNVLLSSDSTRTIIRGMLLSTRDWYPILLQQPSLDPVSLAPVLIDTIDCLFRRDLPIIRLPDDLGRTVFDKSLGLCASLLTHIYDLCEASYYSRSAASATSFDDDTGHNDPYTEIERKVTVWQPPTPSDLMSRCSAQEVAVLTAQARTYRIATLLVIHRLRHPLGVEDEQGQAYAERILEELSVMKQWPSDGATGIGLDFPSTVAMLELPSKGEELFDAMSPLRFRRDSDRQALKVARWIRSQYSRGYQGLWVDLIDPSTTEIILP